MASSQPWPFDDDDDRPSGSVRPLSQADLQAILDLPHQRRPPTSSGRDQRRSAGGGGPGAGQRGPPRRLRPRAVAAGPGD
jgi:hypothetical protein